MSMETDILSQKNRDNIKELTERISKLEIPSTEDMEFKQTPVQIKKLWQSVEMVAKEIAGMKMVLVGIAGVQKVLDQRLTKLEDKGKVKKKSKRKKGKLKAA